MTNDTSTLNGALTELAETMVDNLTTMGVNNASASDGLTTLAGKILDIPTQTGDDKLTSNLTLNLDKSSITIGEYVQISAALTFSKGPIEGAYYHDAQIYLYDGNDLITSSRLTSPCSIMYLAPRPGEHTIRAVFLASQSGLSSYVEDATASKSLTVNKLSSTITCSASSSTIPPGETVTLTGTLSVGSGETVKIYDGDDTLVGTVTTGANGVYSYTTGALNASATFYAVFEGNANYNGVTSSSVTVIVSNSIFIVTSDKDILSYYHSESATLSATLIYNGTPVPGENVTFTVYKSSDDSVVETLTGTTNASGVASVSYESKGAGDIYIKAECMNVSETYVIEDCYAYETSFSNWDSVTNKGSTYNFSDFTLPTNYSISIKMNNSTFQVACGDKTTTDNNGYLCWVFAFYTTNKRLYTRNSNNGEATNTLSYTSDNNAVYTIENNSNVLKLYKDGTQIGNSSYTTYNPLSLTQYIRFVSTNVSSLNYVKVKSL